MQTETRPTSVQPGAVANPLLSVRDLRIEYATEGDPVKAVDGVSFDIAPGEVFGLAGESGSGKSVTSYAVIAAGELDVVTDDVRRLTGHEPSDLETFLRSYYAR